MGSTSLTLRTPSHQSIPCKICEGNAPLFGVQDFNRSCEEVKGRFLPLSGVPIYYRRCLNCGLLFTDAFDDWPDEAFLRHIYNSAYTLVDPDTELARPTSNAELVSRVFAGAEQALDVLDYGGGNGCFGKELEKAGFRTPKTYDRFHPAHRERPAGRYDLITCFETIEHMPDPVRGAADLVSFLKDGGLLFVTTLVQPEDILRQRMHWWYAAARNGHVTLFTHEALARLFARFGLGVYSLSPSTHLICREVPAFAQQVLKPAHRINI